ncbi:MAG: hypothetical protein IMX03_01420 [Brockia lithotrophica]|nr:hypothetical protein [Brockia lithotrophica]
MNVYAVADFAGILSFAEFPPDREGLARAWNLLPASRSSDPPIEAFDTSGTSLRFYALGTPLKAGHGKTALLPNPSPSSRAQRILLADTPWSGRLGGAAAGTERRHLAGALREYLASLPQPGAYALWDGEAEVLTLYRDPTGGRTVFLRAEGSSLAFATHPELLFALYPGKWRLCPEAVAVLFAYGPARPPGSAILCELYELAPGEALAFSRRGEDFLLRREHTRLFASAGSAARPKPSRDVSAALRESLFASVRGAYREGARGVFLSGGLDSSAVLALLRRSAPAEALFSASVDYEGEDAHFVASPLLPERDAAYVGIMVRAAGSEHRAVVLSVEEIVSSLRALGHFRGFPGMLDVDAALLLFFREVSGWNAEIAWLTGEGADETFAGYPWAEGRFLRAAAAHRTGRRADFRRLFPWMRHVDERLALLRPEAARAARVRLDELLLQALGRTDRHLPEESAPSHHAAPLPGAVHPDAGTAGEEEEAVLWASAHTALHFGSVLLERMARAGKATGIRILFPFLDGDVRAFARFARRGESSLRKPLLREALAGVVPEEIRLRRKSPFPKSHHPQLVRSLRARGEELLAAPQARIWSFLDRGAVVRFLRNPPPRLPWFGQLLDAPHYAAYLAEVHDWLERVRPRLPDRDS